MVVRASRYGLEVLTHHHDYEWPATNGERKGDVFKTPINSLRIRRSPHCGRHGLPKVNHHTLDLSSHFGPKVSQRSESVSTLTAHRIES